MSLFQISIRNSKVGARNGSNLTKLYGNSFSSTGTSKGCHSYNWNKTGVVVGKPSFFSTATSRASSSASLIKNNISRSTSKLHTIASPSSAAAALHQRSTFALRNYIMPAVLVTVGSSSLGLYKSTKTERSRSIAGVEEGSEIAQVYQRALIRAKQRELHLSQSLLKRCVANTKRAIRMLVRAVKLMFTLAPVVALYPVALIVNSHDPSVDAHELALAEEHGEVDGALGWYLRLCLRCVESSGAAVIKLMQWAGSRPDMFGNDFCAVFSKLQDDTTPHQWRHTEQMMKEAYGEDWKERIKINKDEILGSGCIGQVYKGEVLGEDGKLQRCAVKVMHPNMESTIDADLDLMRLFVRAAQKLPWNIFATLKWLNLEGAVEEFADLLKLQLDCRVEAANLKQFNQNFADSEYVEFPKIVEGFEPSKDVLIETFCEGIPVLKFAKEYKEDQKLLSEMCFVAIEAVCKMIFLDNFMHGDLHPGNVFIDPKRKKFVLFDVGIVAAYTEDDHVTIVDILTSLIRRQGRQAGRKMIDSSNRLLAATNSGDHAIDEELFIDKIEAMNKLATSSDYLMEHLGSYITTICNAAADHHVLMNQAFISAALAVKIQEGIALALDPAIQIYQVATPILYESERRRGQVQKTAMKLIGLETLFQTEEKNGAN